MDPEKDKEIIFLKDKIEKLEKLEKEQSEFISIIIHQLRAPLTATNWIFKMLLDGDFGNFTEDHKQILERGFEKNEKMIALIQEVLLANQNDNWDFVYNFKKTNINSYINSIVAGYLEQARMNQIHISFKNSAPDLPIVNIDKEKFYIVIENLLENAIKYNTPDGKIIISLDIYPEQKPELEKSIPRLLISFFNTGIGIPKKDQENIFNKFYRASNVQNKIEGNGLGLFSVKKIVEKHNGKIWLESEEGKNVTFFITLPLSEGADNLSTS